MIETLLFWAFAAVSVVASLLVVVQRNPVRGVLALLGVFAGVAGLTLLLSAPLVALLQVTVIAVVVSTVLVAVAWWSNAPDDVNVARVDQGSVARRFGVGLAIVLAVELAWAFQHVRGAAMPGSTDTAATDWTTVATALVRDQPIVGAVAAFIVMAAAIAGAVMARREAL